MICCSEHFGFGLAGAFTVAVALGIALIGFGCNGDPDPASDTSGSSDESASDGSDSSNDAVGDGSVDGGDSGDTECDPEGCAEGLICCSDDDDSSLCVDVLSDNDNCGACGQPCGDGLQCEEGLCVCPVASGLSERCSSAEVCCPDRGCSIPSRDPLNCGSCGASCGPGEFCAEGQCTCAREVAEEGPVCNSAQACCGAPLACRPLDDPECACGDSICGPGVTCCTLAGSETCISTSTNSEHCGGCGIACAVGQRCDAGECVCLDGLANCDFDESTGCETEIRSEPLHCGGCGIDCGAAEQCVLGECSCLLGWGDCNLERPDGCEAFLSTDEAHCGRCGNECAENQECVGGSCLCQAGFADCNASAADGCEVDLNTDLASCGVCRHACGEAQKCEGGDCLCEEGFADCNRTPTDGCEVQLSDDLDNCGVCNRACAANMDCVDGSCRCDSSYGDCNGRSRDGCEAHLVTDPVNCGACERVCTGYAQCGAGSCGCEFGFGDCNGEPEDDCEIDLSSDPDHCGTCLTVCEEGQSCRGGRCQCTFGLADCNENDDDGCEANLDTDSANCGACNRPCGDNQTCVDGGCECTLGFDDCNRSSADGCEADLATDPAHCDECGANCGEGMTCVEGACQCAASFGDCDDDPTDCEADHRVDPSNCEVCGTACGSTRICFESDCICAPERADCDGSGNTCETYLPTSLIHCGECGNPCGNTELCVNGSCVPALNDLVIIELTTDSDTVAANDVLLVNNTAQNIGSDICSANSRIGIYLSTDDTITTDDTLIHWRNIGIPEPLTAVPEYASITIPGTTETGPYYIGAIVDYTEVQRELDETNNIRLGPAVEVLRDVDLTVGSLIPSQTIADVGSRINVDCTINNGGTTITSTNTVQVAIYLSADDTITTDDVQLTTYTHGSLVAGGAATKSISVTIPQSTEPGPHYIGAIADYADLQIESNEGNNTLASVEITLLREVDLVPIQVSTPISTASPGDTIPIALSIQNRGATATTASFSSGIYLSSDDSITIDDARIYSRPLSSLSAGSIDSVTPSVRIPSDTSPGSYFIGAITDYDDTQPETNETNNALTGSSIDVE